MGAVVGEIATLTFVEFGHGRLTLPLVLFLRVFVKGIVRLHVVPGVVLKDIVVFFQVALAELKGVCPFLVELGVVGKVWRDVPIVFRTLRGGDCAQRLDRLGGFGMARLLQ